VPDRWVEAPFAFPYSCHRCGTGRPDDGPYLHLDWQYENNAGQSCRYFQCNRCFQACCALADAPLERDTRIEDYLNEKIERLEKEIQKLKDRPPELKVVRYDEVKAAKTRAKKAAEEAPVD
jgi:hypothetical protein